MPISGLVPNWIRERYMLRTTLRTKFSIALLAVVIVAMFMLMSARLLSKAALFHYLEREHIATVLVVDGALRRLSLIHI